MFARHRSDTMSDGELRFPDWQGPLQEAILEFDSVRLQEQVKKVEAFIQQRTQKLSKSADGHDERVAINDALTLLRIIKRERLEVQ